MDSLTAINLEDESGALPIEHAISACMSNIIAEDKIPPIIQQKWPEDEWVDREYTLFAEIVDYVHGHENCPFSQALLCEFEILWEALDVILPAMHQVLDIKQNTHSPLHKVASMTLIPASILKMVYLSWNFTSDDNGLFPIHIAASARKFPSSDRNEDLAPLWQSKSEPRSMIEYMLEMDPTLATRVTSSGQLPLHMAISTDRAWRKKYVRYLMQHRIR
jgi:hypothetical protein